jgi:GT2 family glycosyltransferase
MESATPFVLVLDADVQVFADTVHVLRKTIGEDPTVGIATPVVLYASRPDTVQYRRTFVHCLAEASADVHPIPLTDLAGATVEVGLASGCSPLIRVETARAVGLFEERYFFGKTDGEFAYRMTVGGYKILETAATQVLHHHTKRGSTYFMHQICNRWHFLLKDFQLRTLIAILPILIVHEPALFMLLLLKGKAGDYFRALASLVRMLPGLGRDRLAVRRMRRRHDWEILRGDKLVIPANVSRGPLVVPIAVYRSLLSLYWSVARAVLRLVSRPIVRN